MVVIVIVGALMAIGYQLLKTVWAEQFSSSSPQQIEELFKYSREMAMAKGKILSLVINLDKKELGISYFDPAKERQADDNLQKMWLKENSSLLSEEERQIRGYEDDDDDDLDEKIKERLKSRRWLVELQRIPGGLEKIYSVSGLVLNGPLVNIHFYPNGTSDSIIFKFKDRAKPYLYLPHQNTAAVRLQKVDFAEVEGANAQ